MDTKTINKLLRNTRYFIGTFACNKLPKKFPKPALFIVNTDPADKPGEHWIGLYVNHKGNGEYFDSFGLPPLNKDIINFLIENCRNGFVYNPRTLQCLDCISCGHYCVVYVKNRSNGKTFCDFINLFTTNQFKNESIVRKYVMNNNKNYK